MIYVIPIPHQTAREACDFIAVTQLAAACAEAVSPGFAATDARVPIALSALTTEDPERDWPTVAKHLGHDHDPAEA